MKTTIGSNRIGGGKKMQVSFDGYQRATFDLSKVVRTTASIGTLIPIYNNIMLPDDTWDIGMFMEVYTNPTIGPLFGTIKGEVHTFTADIRLYNSYLHNNKLRIGNNISQVKFPQLELTSYPVDDWTLIEDLDNSQINPSCVLAYMGIRGVGVSQVEATRQFNALWYIMYIEVYKQYYANLQENIGAVIHNQVPAPTAESIDGVSILSQGATWTISQAPTTGEIGTLTTGSLITINYTGTTPDPKQILFNTMDGQTISVYNLGTGAISDLGASLEIIYNAQRWGRLIITNWRYQLPTDTRLVAPGIVTFDLGNVDIVREEILAFQQTSLPYILNSANVEPYNLLLAESATQNPRLNSQEGLLIKTYMNDKFNNWLETESIEYINNASAVTISGGKFTMDQLNFSKKMYDYLNRTAVAGGSYYDWVQAAWDTNITHRSEMPVYRGGMIKNVVFQERISTAASEDQPLATLGGIGRGAKDHKGGRLVIKPTEPGLIQMILSFTPRIDYSQGNKWFTLLETMEDLFKPAFNGLGFQADINEYRAWWATNYNGADWVQTSAGFLPAFIEYQTDINETYGNFAIANNQMFMTLNRQYQWQEDAGLVSIQDLTTYIDPVRYNQIFAKTSLDSQNLWVQLGLDIQVRRKMSAKIMPRV
ncbi:MAG: major capsid protein [Microviridae sp.]|nr:MAG: major capsid protein [Microviridae sp.]